MNIPVGVILIFMIFFHIVDDYRLQGILSSMKQIKWWKDQCNELGVDYNLYKYDYIVALICHSFSWSFMIMLPILVYNWGNLTLLNYWYILIFNIIVHAIIDNEKANKFRINLVVDQLFHLIQIILSWVACCGVTF